MSSAKPLVTFAPVRVPDGLYTGKWTSYFIAFDFADGGDAIHAHVYTLRNGIRGIDIPIRFNIVEGKLDEGSIEVIK